MSLLDHFEPEQLTSVRTGIQQFTRLTGLIHDQSILVWNKWFTDESDLKLALNSVRDAIKASVTMVGKRKYQGIDYNVVSEVKKSLWTFLTSGADAGETALLKKRNLPMFYLVIEPTIDLFAVFDHEEAILFADEVIDGIRNMVDTDAVYGSYEDALRVQLEVRTLMAAREEAKKAANASKRRKRKPQRDPLLAMLAAIAPETDDEETEKDDEEVQEL